MKEIYISIDCETDGPIPGEYSMLSLGAAVVGVNDTRTGIQRLNPVEDPTLTFYTELKPISDNFIPEAMEVGTFTGLPSDAKSDIIREYLLATGEEAVAGMNRFAQWCFEQKKQHDGVLVFAGYPLGFDWMFTYWYLVKFAEQGQQVFGHSRHLDMKTYYAAKWEALISRSTKRSMPNRLLASKGRHTHNALDDAIEQGELLMNLLLEPVTVN